LQEKKQLSRIAYRNMAHIVMAGNNHLKEIAIMKEEKQVKLDPSILPLGCAGNRLFGLRVKDGAMEAGGIMDGDLVIAKETDSANNGDIVIALIDGEFGVIREYQKVGNTVELRAQSALGTEYAYGKGSSANIQGVVVALIRTYGEQS
jgi:SOS-response transcriptional repressor LexA